MQARERERERERERMALSVSKLSETGARFRVGLLLTRASLSEEKKRVGRKHPFEEGLYFAGVVAVF